MFGETAVSVFHYLLLDVCVSAPAYFAHKLMTRVYLVPHDIRRRFVDNLRYLVDHNLEQLLHSSNRRFPVAEELVIENRLLEELVHESYFGVVVRVHFVDDYFAMEDSAES